MTKGLKTAYRIELTCPHINLTTYKTCLYNENFMRERVFYRNCDFVTLVRVRQIAIKVAFSHEIHERITCTIFYLGLEHHYYPRYVIKII